MPQRRSRSSIGEWILCAPVPRVSRSVVLTRPVPSFSPRPRAASLDLARRRCPRSRRLTATTAGARTKKRQPRPQKQTLWWTRTMTSTRTAAIRSPYSKYSKSPSFAVDPVEVGADGLSYMPPLDSIEEDDHSPRASTASPSKPQPRSSRDSTKPGGGKLTVDDLEHGFGVADLGHTDADASPRGSGSSLTRRPASEARARTHRRTASKCSQQRFQGCLKMQAQSSKQSQMATPRFKPT